MQHQAELLDGYAARIAAVERVEQIRPDAAAVYRAVLSDRPVAGSAAVVARPSLPAFRQQFDQAFDRSWQAVVVTKADTGSAIWHNAASRWQQELHRLRTSLESQARIIQLSRRQVAQTEALTQETRERWDALGQSEADLTDTVLAEFTAQAHALFTVTHVVETSSGRLDPNAARVYHHVLDDLADSLDQRLELAREHRAGAARTRERLADILAPLTETARPITVDPHGEDSFGQVFAAHAHLAWTQYVNTLMAEAETLDIGPWWDTSPQAARSLLQAEASTLIDKATATLAFADALSGLGDQLTATVEAALADPGAPGGRARPETLDKAAAAIIVQARAVYRGITATRPLSDVPSLVRSRFEELAAELRAMFAFRVQARTRVVDAVRDAEGAIPAPIADQVLHDLLTAADTWYQHTMAGRPRRTDRPEAVQRELDTTLTGIRERLAFENLVHLHVERAAIGDVGIAEEFFERSPARLTADGMERIGRQWAEDVQAAISTARQELAAKRFAVEHLDAASAAVGRSLEALSAALPTRLTAELHRAEAIQEADTAFADLTTRHALPETALQTLAEDFRNEWVRNSQLVHEAEHIAPEQVETSNDATHLVVWVNSALKRLGGPGTPAVSLAEIAPVRDDQARITPGLTLPWMAERIAYAMLGRQRPRLPGAGTPPSPGEATSSTEAPAESSAQAQRRAAAATQPDSDTESQLTGLAADADVVEEVLAGSRWGTRFPFRPAEHVGESLDAHATSGHGHQAIEMEDLTRPAESNGSPFLVPGALGDLIVGGSARFEAGQARLWARRVLQTTHLPEPAMQGLTAAARQEMRTEVENALADLLASEPDSTRSEQENLAWEEKLHLGHAFVSQDRLVWLKPVLRDVRPRPTPASSMVEEKTGGAREYRVSFGSTVGEGVTSQEKRWEGATQFINVLAHNASRIAASVVAVPLISVTGATAGKDSWAKLNIAGSKPFVQDRVAHHADLVFRVFVDGQEARYAVRDPAVTPATTRPAVDEVAGETDTVGSEESAALVSAEFTGEELAEMVASKHPGTVVPRGLVVEYAAAFVGEQAQQPLDVVPEHEAGSAGDVTGSADETATRSDALGHARSRIPLVLNAIDITSAVADLHAALRGADLRAHVVVHVLKELKEQLSERGLRNRSRLVLGAGDMSGPIVVRGRAGGKLFDGHLRIRLAAEENGVKLHSLAKQVTVRDDIGSGTTLTHDNKFESTATLSASYTASGLRWAADPNEPVPSVSITGTAPMLAGGGAAKRGGSTGEGAQTLTHTVLNATDDLVRATATLRLEIDVVSRTHQVRTVEARVPSEIGAPLRGGRGIRFLARDWALPEEEVSQTRPAWLDTDTAGEAPFAYTDHPGYTRYGSGPAGVDMAFAVATMMPGSERVERQFRTMIAARVPELTFRQTFGTPLNPTAVDNELASFFGRHALEADISEALHGIVHTVAVADRQFRLTAKLHLRREPFDEFAFASTVNQRQMTTTESTSGVDRTDGFAVGAGAGFRLDVEPKNESAEPDQSGGRFQFSASPEYAREYSSTDTFQTASSSYRRTEATGTVDEKAYDAAWELSFEEVAADSPKTTVWLSRPGVVTAQVIAPPIAVEPEMHSPLVNSARRLNVTRPLPVVGGATSGLYAQFAQMPHLLNGVEDLYRELHGTAAMAATEVPAVLTRLLSPKSLSAHFEEMSSLHGWVAGLPRRGGWNQAVQVRLQVVEHVRERGITSERRELEQYQAGRSMYTSARGVAASGALAAELSGQYRYTRRGAETRTGPNLPESASTSQAGTVSATQASTAARSESTAPPATGARRFVPGAFDDSIDEDFAEDFSRDATVVEELRDEELRVPGAFPTLRDHTGDTSLHRRGPTVVNPGGQQENAALRDNEVLRAGLSFGAGGASGWGSTHNTGTGDIHVSRVTYVDTATVADGTVYPVHPTVIRGDVRIVVNLIRWRDGTDWLGNLRNRLARGERTGAEGEQEEAFKSLSLAQHYGHAATVLVPHRLLERIDEGLAAWVAKTAVLPGRISDPADLLAETAPITAAHADSLSAALDALSETVLAMRAAADTAMRADQPAGGDLRTLADSVAAVSDAIGVVRHAAQEEVQALDRILPFARLLHRNSVEGASAVSRLSDQVEMADGGAAHAAALTTRLRYQATRIANFGQGVDALAERLKSIVGLADEAELKISILMQEFAAPPADAAARVAVAVAVVLADDDTLLNSTARQTLPADLAVLAARQSLLADGTDDLVAQAAALVGHIDDAAADEPVTRGYHRLLPVTALHAEELEAPLVFDNVVEALARGGLLRRVPVGDSPIPHLSVEGTQPVIPDDLYRALRSNFSSEALRNQFHALMGSGVVGWYAVPKWEGLGARLVRVRVRAKELKPAFTHRLRTDAKMMLRSEAVTQTERVSDKSRRYFGSAAGKINGGRSNFHGGVSVDAGVDIEDLTSQGQQTKDVDIYRVDPKDPSLAEFGHKVDLRVEIDVAGSLPAIVAAPRDLLSSAWNRAATGLGLESSAVSKAVAGAAQTMWGYIAPWTAVLSKAGAYLGMEGANISHHDSFLVHDQEVRTLVPTSFTVPATDDSAVTSWHRPHVRSYERRWVPPTLTVPDDTAASALSDLHPWDIEALYPLRTWAKVAALNTVTPPVIEPAAAAKVTARLASPTPGSVAEAIYDHAVSYNTVRPRIESLLRGTYLIPVGDTVVRARLRLTGYEDFLAESSRMKVRRYNPTTTAPKNENETSFAYSFGGGVDLVGVPRSGQHLVVNLPAKREWKSQAKNVYEVGMTDESNRLNDTSYRTFLFDTVLELEPVARPGHPPRRALHIVVPGGLVASIPNEGPEELATRLATLIGRTPPVSAAKTPADPERGDLPVAEPTEAVAAALDQVRVIAESADEIRESAILTDAAMARALEDLLNEDAEFED
ncbi:hypothetical protein KGQ19_40460 [Catenulispora sp. NL8]|uniref:Uncharacterized protein n=1 Tax=Catenulispora pinistramenti TaxID=2705254 RepID=A0ABS5L4B8_9ACTN|nr:hypothetical protein [Catenulispora pinistramenti]MBS2553146.1 hypothetical protein [Catenulispora pinistramenti]